MKSQYDTTQQTFKRYKIARVVGVVLLIAGISTWLGTEATTIGSVIAYEPAKGPLAQVTCSPSGRDQYNDLKLEINRLIWQYAPEETKLGTADELACKILSSILAGRYLV